MKRVLASFTIATLLMAAGYVGWTKTAEAAFNAGNLIADAEFISSTTLNAAGVQAFLNTKGGTRLRAFREGGRTAAQIIADAARSNGLNPFVILATIQKEESLVESNTNFDFRVNWAMGYGVCDSCSTDDPSVVKYRGFTNQINNGAWQLKYNYSHYAGNGSDWNVGKTMVIDGTAVRFSTRGTSALYRYTPHLGGNQNFYNIYNRYKSFRGAGGTTAAAPGTYEAQLGAQGPRSGAGAPGVTLRPGQRFTVWVNYKNTGGATWYQGTANPVRLGTAGPQDRTSAFMNNQNLRGTLVQGAVRSGGTGTFRVNLTAPAQNGTYTERFRAVAEHVNWMGEEATFTFTVSGSGGAAVNGAATASTPTGNYSATYQAQGPRSGAGAPGVTLARGQRFTVWVNYRNSGSSTWSQGGANPVRLGTAGPQDRTSAFMNNQNIRGTMQQGSVAPGGTGTFRVTLTAPSQAGTYTERFRPVAEYSNWMGEEAAFTFTVR